jgi:4-amino-4-deoxy-L-arabinose transferase-like glycosyltransferase
LVATALVTFAILAGAGLRYTAIEDVPPGLNQDEAVYGYDAYSLALTGRDHLGHPFPIAGLESFGAFTPPLLSLISAPFVAVFGLDVGVLRRVSASAGILAIPLVYLLALQLLNRRSLAVLAAWIIALSPWHIHVSRWAFPPTLVPTMTTLTMLLLVWSLRRGSNRGIVAAAAAAALTVLTYLSMIVYVPLLVAATIAIFWRWAGRLRREALVYALLVFLLIAGPMLYVTATDPSGRARYQQTSVFNATTVQAGTLAQQYLSYFSPAFLFYNGDGDPMHSPPGFGVELATAIPFLLAGLAFLVYRIVRPLSDWQRSSALYLLGALALYPLAGTLTLPAPHTLRAVHLLPLTAIIAASGALALWDVAGRILSQAPAIARRAALAALVIAAVIPVHNELHARYRTYFDDYPNQVARQFQYGLQQALEYAQAHAGEYDEIWVTDTNQPYIYVLFFNRVSPNDVHRMLPVIRDPPQFNQVPAFEKYRFGGLPAGVTADSLPVLTTILLPDGGVAYQVRGGTTPGGRRVMLIER